MKILFLANRTPYPPYRGDKLKIYHLARQLAKEHELHLITFAQSRGEFDYRPELEEIFKEVHLVYLPKWLSALQCVIGVFSKMPFQLLYFRSRRMKKVLAEYMSTHQPDVIHTQHLRMSQYSSEYTATPRILDLPDAFSMYWKRRANLDVNIFVKTFNRMEFRKLYNYEKVIRNFELNLVCSEEDRQFLITEHDCDRVDILPNGVDQEAFAARGHNYDIDDRLIFTGNMKYAPNIDAIPYFVEEIFPLIKKARPGVKLYIVGQRPGPAITRLQSDDIIVTGFVKDLGAEYDKSAVAISPIRIGAGTLNKVLEAMSMGVPVVCTHVGFKGLGIKSGEGAVLANNSEAFAAEVIRLLEDKELRRSVGQAGIRVIRENYTWETIAARLEGYFYSVLGKKEVIKEHGRHQA